jgi:hypothetical protein
VASHLSPLASGFGRIDELDATAAEIRDVAGDDPKAM